MIPNQKQLIDKINSYFQGPEFTPQQLFKIGVVFSVLAILVFMLNICFVYIKPGEYGVKIKLWGGSAGIQEKLYSTGLHFVIPTMHVIERFPKNIQVIQLTNYKSYHKSYENVVIENAAHIQTYDGYFVDVGVSVLYHIEDPLKVIKSLGKKGIYEQAIIPKVVPALKQTLGKLTTEEFYNSKLRTDQMKKAKELLSANLAEKGLDVDQVLIRYFVYSDEIQSNIEEKKLKDQLVFKNQAEAKAAKEAAELKKVSREGAANVAVILEKGKAYVTKKNAEKEAYVRKRKAEADLLIKLAEADKVRRRNTALRSGGSDKMVGLEMAKLLQGVDTIILPSDGRQGINPLDLRKTLSTFEVK